MRRALLTALAATLALPGALALGPTAPAGADTSPTGHEYRPITFPVRGTVSYYDDFGNCRDGCRRGHEGNDLMGAKMQPLLAAVDGRVTFIRADASGNSGNMLTIKDDAGWTYLYIHINNDSPGTDDGANRRDQAFAPGIEVGARVRAGQHIAYMGDSGNAEGTAPHLHFEMHEPDGTPFSPYVSLRLAQGIPAGGLCRFPSNPKPAPDAEANRGYWAVDATGAVFAFGDAPYLGGANQGRPRGAPPIVDLAPTPSGNGYWQVDAAGTVHPFGDARQHGGMGGTRLNAPIIGITPTGTGRGYWLLGRDGGIFSFGDARFHGSTGNLRLAAPVIGMATTDAGRGYWLLGRDGGVFSFGDARFTGSLPGTGRCELPDAVSMTRSRTGRGYFVLLADGRINAFGDAALHGEPARFGARPLSIDVVP